MTLNLESLLALIESGDDKAAIEKFFATVGPIAARACVEKMYHQAPEVYSGAGAEKALAQIGFLECRHFLRVGGDSYGVSNWPGVGGVADIIYQEGEARTQIHDWCNSAAYDLLASAAPAAGVDNGVPTVDASTGGA